MVQVLENQPTNATKMQIHITQRTQVANLNLFFKEYAVWLFP